MTKAIMKYKVGDYVGIYYGNHQGELTRAKVEARAKANSGTWERDDIDFESGDLAEWKILD